jgi:hypothetical protein
LSESLQRVFTPVTSMMLAIAPIVLDMVEFTMIFRIKHHSMILTLRGIFDCFLYGTPLSQKIRLTGK